MNAPADRLSSEIERLFGGAGPVRAAFLIVARNSDWPALSALLGGLESELELPLPALSVDASGGYRLWFSFSAPMPAADVSAFLRALIRRYLADLPTGRVQALVPAKAAELPAMPAEVPETERWSAFIDPGMGAMFRDEPGLDISPGRDRQADLLTGVHSLTPVDLARALQEMGAPVATGSAMPIQFTHATVPPVTASWKNVGTAYGDPRDFLRAVMNDPGASPEHRLRAAEALLQVLPARVD